MAIAASSFSPSPTHSHYTHHLPMHYLFPSLSLFILKESFLSSLIFHSTFTHSQILSHIYAYTPLCTHTSLSTFTLIKAQIIHLHMDKCWFSYVNHLLHAIKDHLWRDLASKSEIKASSTNQRSPPPKVFLNHYNFSHCIICNKQTHSFYLTLIPLLFILTYLGFLHDDQGRPFVISSFF